MRGSTALVAVTMLLGGCASGAAEPASTTIGAGEPSAVVSAPSVEVSVEADDAEELEPPEMPALAREQTPEGAVAFAEWWFDTLNYATATGDTSGLADASDAQCETCANFISQIEGAYSRGGHIEGGLTSASIDAPGGMEVRGINLAVFAEVEAMTIVDHNGDVVEALASGSDILVFAALATEDGWRTGAVSSAGS